ncbi:MAG: alkaline phosphatase [Gammaproteobacteria bacterium]|jgi:hypothetical protein|nr:alkaline phosphatase [Gammaproteobacteria bacterium]|tara:strand:- start:1302 stop:1616 length:315 start_codon:yes stop_codon:yes gene_type:complete
MTKDQQTEVEAAAFRALVAHLQQRSDAQNIDLMNLAGFCRNCLSKWYSAAAKKLDPDFNYADGQQYVYGMSIDEWKRDYQTKANDAQLQRFEDTKPQHAKISGY